MKVDRSMQHAVMQPQAVPAGGAGNAMKAADAGKSPRPETWAVSGIVSLALLFAGAGPGLAVASGHGHAGHARPHHPTAVSHHDHHSTPMRHGHISERPWMY
jgi:hypothetical protein